MDTLRPLDVTELIFITGHLKEQVEQYATGRYGIPCRYIEQRVQDGTAGAVNLARPHVTGPVLVVFVDTVFEADLTLINRTGADGIIWAKEVEDYQRFGVVVTDADGYMTRIVEKPKEPVSRLANIGLYYIKDVAALWQGIDHVLAAPKNQGEYFLTDAFQWMIERGRKILTAEVGGWYDCGKLDTLLETNEILLRKGAARRREFPGVTITDPVLIEDGVTIERSSIGPNVTLESGTVVRDSELAHTVVGRRCELFGPGSITACSATTSSSGTSGEPPPSATTASSSEAASGDHRSALPLLPRSLVPFRSGRGDGRRRARPRRPAR